MQVLLRNPLADPYVLGISGGAAVGALAAMLAGAARARSTPAAFAGALGCRRCWCSGSRAPARERAPWTLDAPAADRRRRRRRLGRADRADADARARRAGARHAVLADRRPVGGRRRGAARWSRSRVALAVALPFARDLNVLARGEDAARGARRRGARALTLAALRARVARDGRRGDDRRQRRLRRAGRAARAAPRRSATTSALLLPASALAGGTLLLLADTLARTIAAPVQLPVGVITALDRRAGVPLAACAGAAR